MQSNVPSQQASSPTQRPVRLHYLDWLRVLAILMVVLFHAVHPFDFGGWHIKNAEQSEVITILLVLLSLWGMPFFFLVAGAASWFALQRRTPGQYVSERFKRLLVPFIVGTILFRPLVTYLEWMNRVQRGDLAVSFQEFLKMIAAEYASLGFSPRWFGAGPVRNEGREVAPQAPGAKPRGGSPCANRVPGKRSCPVTSAF